MFRLAGALDAGAGPRLFSEWMVKLHFLFPGKTREPFLAQGVGGYLKRLQTLVPARESIVKSGRVPPGAPAAAEAAARRLEAAAVLENCRPGEALVVLDISGRQLASPELADWFAARLLAGTKAVNLVVGGPWGVEDGLTARADLRLSFGPMTFPHELARVMLLEQVYRAFAIINRLPYHK